MKLLIEIIEEALAIIKEFPNDKKVIHEQNLIINRAVKNLGEFISTKNYDLQIPYIHN